MGAAAFTGPPDKKDVAAFENILDDDLNTREPDLEAQATETEETPLETETQEAAAEETSEEKSTETEETEVELEAAAAAESEAETEEEGTVSTLSDLAQAFETSEETLLETIQITAGDQTVSLGEALKAHTANPAAASELAGLQQERAAYQVEADASRKSVGEAMKQLAAQTQVFADQIDAKYKDVNWAQLKEEDPSQFLLLRNEQQEDNHRFRAAVDVIQRTDEDRQAQVRQDLERFERVETVSLLQKIPEWNDEAVAREELGKINTYLNGHGFTKQEISMLNDHRYMLIVRDAHRYAELKKGAPKKMKKLKGLPKPTKVIGATARSRVAAVTKKATDSDLLRQRLKKSGDVEDAARYFESEVDFDAPSKSA